MHGRGISDVVHVDILVPLFRHKLIDKRLIVVLLCQIPPTPEFDIYPLGDYRIGRNYFFPALLSASRKAGNRHQPRHHTRQKSFLHIDPPYYPPRSAGLFSY